MKRKADRSKSPKSSADPARPPGRSLQLAEDMAFQERNWRAERIAWMAMALTVLAALLGLFGSGPLSEARSADPSGALEVSYSRFLRLSAPASITVKARPAPAPAERFALQLDAEFTQAFRIASVTPLRLGLNERPGRPVNGQAERRDPLPERTEGGIEEHEEALGLFPRLGQVVEPAVAEHEAVRGLPEAPLDGLDQDGMNEAPVGCELEQDDFAVTRPRGHDPGTRRARAICSSSWMIRSSLAPTQLVSHQTR